MNRTIAVFLIFTFLRLPCLYAQPAIQLNDVKDFSFSNLQFFTNSTGVAGYSCCYEVNDRSIDGKRYLVKTYSTNLEETNTWTFTCNNRENLLATAYNGTHFMTLILDPKKKILYHKIYDIASKTEILFEDKLDVNSEYYLEKHISSDINLPGGAKMLQTFGNGDFVSIIPTKHNNVFTYDVNIFTKNNGYRKVVFTPETNFKTQQASFVGHTEDLLLFYVFRKKDLASNKYESNLVGIETATGKQKFEISTKEGDAPFLPLKVAYRQGQKDFTVLGNYFKENERINSDNFKGLCLLQMNDAGQITARTTLNWKEHFGETKIVNGGVDEEGMVEDSTVENIQFYQVHAFGQAANGGLFVAGEGYRYRERPGVVLANVLLAGAGVAGALAGKAVGVGNISSNTFMVGDLVLIHADSSLKIDSIVRIPKKEHYAAGFDTDFCVNMPTQNQFVMAYRDYNSTQTKREFWEKMLVYHNGTTSLFQNNLLPDAATCQVLPATENEVLLIAYNSRENQLSFSVQPLRP